MALASSCKLASAAQQALAGGKRHGDVRIEEKERKRSNSDAPVLPVACVTKDTSLDEEEGVEPRLPVHLRRSKKNGEKRAAHESKKALERSLLSQIPKTDENGVAYNKIQLRRMKKRVKHGLPAVLSLEEEELYIATRRREKQREDAEIDELMYSSSSRSQCSRDEGLRRVQDDKEDYPESSQMYRHSYIEQEEEEDAGIDDKSSEEGAEVEADAEANAFSQGKLHEEKKGLRGTTPSETSISTSSVSRTEVLSIPNTTRSETSISTSAVLRMEVQSIPNKKNKRIKPVPSDYVCQACQNDPIHGERHWIYDCPVKKTVRGINKKAKKLRGVAQPPKTKVFVSGLPFGIKAVDVVTYFTSRCCARIGGSGDDDDGERNESNLNKKSGIVQCKLVTFPDTQKCRGQAYLTFATEEMSEKALSMNRTIFNGVSVGGHCDNRVASGDKRWLCVTRVKNRLEIQKERKQRQWIERTKDRSSAG